MEIQQKKEKLIEARNRISEGIKLLREVFNDSKDQWKEKWCKSMIVALGFSVDICSRLDDSIFKIDKYLNKE